MTVEGLNALVEDAYAAAFEFEEELAKTGASDKSQIYGEIGLEYGNQAAHGVLRGLLP